MTHKRDSALPVPALSLHNRWLNIHHSPIKHSEHVQNIKGIVQYICKIWGFHGGDCEECIPSQKTAFLVRYISLGLSPFQLPLSDKCAVIKPQQVCARTFEPCFPPLWAWMDTVWYLRCSWKWGFILKLIDLKLPVICMVTQEMIKGSSVCGGSTSHY
jgi:hypothetical protein